MFRLKGSIEVRLIESRTGNIDKVIKQDNLIPANTYQLLPYWNCPENFFGGRRISISTSTATPSLNNHTLVGVIATGYVPAGVTSPTWNEGIDPPFGQIQNRIDFVGTSRTFHSVGLTGLSSNNNQGGVSTTAYAYLKLDTPCIQEETQYIDIFYRIQFVEASTEGFIDSKLARYDFGRTCFGLTGAERKGFKMSYLYASLFQMPVKVYQSLAISGFNLANVYYFSERTPDNVLGWTLGQKIDSHYKWRYGISRDRNTDVGVIYNLMPQGLSNDNKEIYNISKFDYKEEPFQTGFWHTHSAPGSFFEVSTIGSSQGTIHLSGTWTGNFPELYKFTITSGGGTGIATYKFSMMKHLGIDGNSFNSRETTCPFLQFARQPALGIHGWKEEDFDRHRFSNTKIIQYDLTGVTLLDLMNGDYKNWDSSTSPTLGVSQLRQVAVDSLNQKIYCACRITGLWIIDVNSNTITQPLNNPCYGVDVGRNSTAYAVIDGGLYRSTNWATPLSFTYVDITTNWSKVKFLKADPEHVNDRLGIVCEASPGLNKIAWHEVSTSTAIEGYGENVNGSSVLGSYCGGLDCSDSGSIWFFAETRNINLVRLSFNSANKEREIEGLAKTFTHSVYGDSFFQKVSFYNNRLLSRYVIEDVDNIPNNIDYPDIDSCLYALHLDSGITLFGNLLRQIFNASSLKWTDYGWDGSTWAKDNAGTKTTHTANQSLINGLQVRFANGINPPHFTATNFFTQGINYGLLKDNSTTIDDYQSAWYSVTADFDYPVQAGLTIPVTSPYEVTLNASSVFPTFIRLETDSVELTKLTIGGQPTVKVYNDGSTPAPQEVSLDPSGNGKVYFNAADAGKTVGGTYCYLKF